MGPYVGGLEPLLGLILTVLGGSWDLYGWSWVRPEASVGDPVPLLGPLWVVLGGSWASVDGPAGGPWGEKWPKPEREHDPQKGRAP